MRCRRKRQRIAAAAFCAASWEEGRSERRSARRRLLVRRDHASLLRLVCVLLLAGGDSSGREQRFVGENRCRVGAERAAVDVNSVPIPYRAFPGVSGVFANDHNTDRRPTQATLRFVHSAR